MIELSMPAGNLEIALASFKAGSNSVYFGMKDFSARKGAVNFSLDDLAIIKQYAKENNKKIYITINTLINDDNIDKVNTLLSQINFYNPDGVIVQDLGLAYLIKTHYPNLNLHASTQLAVHTIDGVKFLESIGFKRVVLSRELSLKEIKEIRLACPNIELKAFVHGALCYGFSGLCMASYLKCGRSANKGECAQLCRSWYKNLDTNKNGYFFSMNDFNAGYNIKKLDSIGIDSAKIEGRLKSAEYVTSLTQYYLDILHNRNVKEEDFKTTFSRSLCDGYLNYEKTTSSLTNRKYPSHLGLELGSIIDQKRSMILVEKNKTIRNRDGLQVLVRDSNSLLKAEKFAAKIINETENTYTLSYSTTSNLINNKLYKISSSVQNEKKFNTNLKHYKKPIDIKISVTNDSLEASYEEISHKIEIKTENLIKGSFKEQSEKLFSSSDKSKYTLANLIIENNSSNNNPFIPLSIFKSFKRDFYTLLDQREIYKAKLELENTKLSLKLPPRSLFSKDLPWSNEKTTWNNYSVFTFAPVTFCENEDMKNMEENVKNEKNVLIGLNNISQLEFAKKHPEYKYFIDVFLPISNSFTVKLFKDALKDNLIASYSYIEDDVENLSKPMFTPPSFISRVCFRHESMGLSCKDCKRHYDYHIKDNDKFYTVKVRNCLTITSIEK